MSEKDLGMKEGNELEKGQVIKEEKAKRRRNRIGWGCLIAILLFFLLFIPLSCGGITFTQPVSGKVIDRETKKPIPDARIKVEWTGQPVFYLETVHSEIKEETYKTDKEGNFKIPSLFTLTPLLSFNEVEILVYAHRYKAVRITREPGFFGTLERGRFTPEQKEILPKGIKRKGTIIELKPLKTAEEWAENLEFLRFDVFGYKDWEWSEEEKDFWREERRQYEEFKRKEQGISK